MTHVWSFFHHPPFPTANTIPCHCFRLLNNSMLFIVSVTIGYLDYSQSFALPIKFLKIVLLQGCWLPQQCNCGPNSMSVSKAFHKEWRISSANVNQPPLSLGADDIISLAHFQNLAFCFVNFFFFCLSSETPWLATFHSSPLRETHTLCIY